MATRAVVLLLFNPTNDRVWVAQVDNGKLPEGTTAPGRLVHAGQHTVPSIQFRIKDGEPQPDLRAIATKLFEDTFDVDLVDENLMWLEHRIHNDVYGVDRPVKNEYEVFVYRCTEPSILSYNEPRPAHGYTNQLWLQPSRIYNIPYDIDVAPVQPIWLLRDWVWFGQRALHMTDAIQRCHNQATEEGKHGRKGTGTLAAHCAGGSDKDKARWHNIDPDSTEGYTWYH